MSDPESAHVARIARWCADFETAAREGGGDGEIIAGPPVHNSDYLSLTDLLQLLADHRLAANLNAAHHAAAMQPCTSRAHATDDNGQRVPCLRPAGHVMHRNMDREWTP